MVKKNQAERQAELADKVHGEGTEQMTEQTTEQVNDPAAVKTLADEAKGPTKTIVPPKYAGKYKNGGQGPLSDFIRQTCGEGDKFEFTAFWELCRKNGISEEQITKYKQQVDDKAHGANGRARMTLANSLRAIARKQQTLKNLAGDDVAVPEPKIAASGAVKAAQEAKQADTGNGGAASQDPAGSEAGSEQTE